MKQLYKNILDEYVHEVPKAILWDYIKTKVKEFSITYCIAKTKNRNDICKQLQKTLDNIDKQLSDCYFETLFLERQRVKLELDDIYRTKSEGYQIRSRAKWVDDRERSTRYFLNLEKARQNHNCIISLTCKTGKTVTSDEEILNVAKEFYSDFFTSKNVSDSTVNSFFDDVTPENVLSEELMQKCEGILTKDECHTAVTNMKGNKAPGLDGLTIEFYKHFWPLFGSFLVDTLNETYENGCLTRSQRMSVLSLIFKKR